MATDGGVPTPSKSITTKVVCQFPEDPNGKLAGKNLRQLYAEGVISFKDPATGGAIRRIPENDLSFPYAPATLKDPTGMTDHPLRGVLPQPAQAEFDEYVERPRTIDLADSQFDGQITGASFWTYARGKENDENAVWIDETTDRWHGWILRIAAAYQTFCHEETIQPKPDAGTGIRGTVTEIDLPPPPPQPDFAPSPNPPESWQLGWNGYIDDLTPPWRFEIPLLVSSALLFLAAVGALFYLRRGFRFDLVASRLIQGKEVAGGAGRLGREGLFRLRAVEARRLRNAVPQIRYERGLVGGSLTIERAHLNGVLRHLEDRYVDLVGRGRFPEADGVDYQIGRLKDFFAENGRPRMIPTPAGGSRLEIPTPLVVGEAALAAADPAVVITRGSTPGAIVSNLGVRVVTGRHGRLQVIPMEEAALRAHMETEGTMVRAVGPRPDGPIHVQVLDKTVRAPVPEPPAPVAASGRPPPIQTLELTVVRKLGRPAFADPDRVVFIEYAGEVQRWDAEQIGRFFRYCQTKMSRLLKGGSYRRGDREALELYSQMLTTSKAWHGSAVGYAEIPILPGGSIVLSAAEKDLLGTYIGRPLEEGTILVTLDEEGIGKLTVRQIERAAKRVAELIGSAPDVETRFKALGLLETIYEGPYLSIGV